MEEEKEQPTDYKALIKDLRSQRDDYLKLKERRAARAKARKEKDAAKDKEDTDETEE